MTLSISDLVKARKLHARRMFGGLDISVENAKGTTRRWYAPHGKETGSTKMLHDYGYIRRTLGTDGDHVDVYVGPHEHAPNVYVVDQMKKPDFTKFDEMKCFLGFLSAKDAKRAYLAHYNDKRFFGGITAVPFAQFATWVLSTKDSAPSKERFADRWPSALVKGAPRPNHKYKSRKMGANGEWEYEYDEPSEPHVRTGTIDLSEAEVNNAVDWMLTSFFGPEHVTKDGKLVNLKGWEPESHDAKIRDARGAKLVVPVKLHIAQRAEHDPRKVTGEHLSSSQYGRILGHSVDLYVAPSWEGEPVADLKRALRDVLAHELTHAADVGLTEHTAKQTAPKKYVFTRNAKKRARRKQRTSAAADVMQGGKSLAEYKKYLNLPHEVTASIKQITRDILDAPVSKNLLHDADKHARNPDWPPPERVEELLSYHSPRWERVGEHYTEENKRRVYRAVADLRTAILERKIHPIEKSLTLRGLVRLAKGGPYIGPRGGKWADPEHTIHWEDVPHVGAPEHEPKKWKTATTFTEHDFTTGAYDKEPLHWHVKHTDGRPVAWTRGGVSPLSHAPVKQAARIDKLYTIESPEIAGRPGFAMLREVGSGEKLVMQHNRIFAVEHDPLRRKVVRKPEDTKPVWDPTKRSNAAGGPTVVGERAPSFEGSRADAVKQPGLHAIENGIYSMKDLALTSHGGAVKEKKRRVVAVPDHGKNLLVHEFTPLIMSTVNALQRSYGVKDVYEQGAPGKRATNVTKLELQRAGIEGLLMGIERYDPSRGPFSQHVKHYVANTIRLAAAREKLGGIEMPDTQAKNLSKFLAARAEAGKQHDTDHPSEEQIARHFKLLMRDVHPNMGGTPEGNKPVPLDNYKLSAIEEVAPHEKDLPLALRTSVSDTEERPGKRELISLYNEFLTGQASSKDIFDLEENYAFPGVEVGAGLSESERVLVRNATQKVLSTMGAFEITTEGRKKITYRADAGEMLALKLGLRGGDEMTTAEIARDVLVYAIGASGEPKVLAPRQAHAVVETMIERALSYAKNEIAQKDAALIFERAAEKLTPVERPVPGPTWTQIIQKRATDVTPAQIAEYRDGERSRLRTLAASIRARAKSERSPEGRTQQEMLASGAEEAARRVDRMSEDEVRTKIAMRLAPETAEMRKLATQSVVVEMEHRGYERTSMLTTMRDPKTGAERQVRVRALRDMRDPEELPAGEIHRERMTKAGQYSLADARRGVTTGMLREALHYPRTMKLLSTADVPTLARRSLELLAFGE